MINSYKSINDRLNNINFNQIINGFKRCTFAIFDNQKAVIDGKVIAKPSQFVANSVADYNDNLVATFHHDFLPKDLNKATALIVHEMYHAFQFGKMKYQAPFINNNEQDGIFYDYSVDTLTLKYNEVICLIGAYLNKSKEDYHKFLSIRKLRKDKYPQAVQYENATEFIEGSATYVELKALEQLDNKRFNKEIAKTMESLKNIEFYFSIRELSYKVGALMLLTLDELNIDYSDVIKGKMFISEACACNYVKPKIENKPEIKQMIKEKNAINKVAVEQFFSKDHYKINYDEIVGYNPMGITRYKNKLLVKYLVIIKVNGKQQTLNGDFCLIFDDNKECVKLYQLTT